MMKTSMKQNETTGRITKKSGKGLSDGVISELSAFFTVKPGHEEELRAALHRFAEMLHNSDPKDIQRAGLRDTRHVIFNDGRQLVWITAFESDWDPYIDDALQLINIKNFLDWMQHTVEGDKVVEWVKSTGGVEKFDPNDPAIKDTIKRTSGQLKAILQSVQVQASTYFNSLSGLTMPQIVKAQRVAQAFQQVLDDPAAEEALQHPALKPLLEQAAY
ncbi:MAG TPA: hypothetical protein VGJ92_11485 [Methanocella sp.]|jgi:hypothetical protein